MGGSSFRSEAALLTNGIEARFRNPTTGHYAGYATTAGERTMEPETGWARSIHLAALSAACRVDPETYVPIFDRAIKPVEAPPLNQRFYDSEARCALATLELFEITHQEEYLRRALRISQFVMTGISPALGGGVYWQASNKRSKHTCTTGAVMLLAARLYLATGVKSYLDTALSLHQWSQQLKDTDQLLFDNVQPNGSIDKVKRSRNSALMIQSALLLHCAMPDANGKAFLPEAVAMAAAAVDHWIDPATGAIRDEGSFSHHLVEALLQLAPLDSSRPWRAIAETAVRFAQLNCQRNSVMGYRWDRFEPRDDHVLLYEASMARALWLCAIAAMDEK